MLEDGNNGDGGIEPILFVEWIALYKIDILRSFANIPL